jgi:hypothetical protein
MRVHPCIMTVAPPAAIDHAAPTSKDSIPVADNMTTNDVHMVLHEPCRFQDLYQSLGLTNASPRDKQIHGYAVDILDYLGPDSKN